MPCPYLQAKVKTARQVVVVHGCLNFENRNPEIRRKIATAWIRDVVVGFSKTCSLEILALA